uniref:Uncharacterized protein n=1 Tax=Panagrolaimus sp. PS1159 TaxID=55785 RepID=A0AC35F6L4_9BILA
MSQNPPIKKPTLNDVDYFNYFESQSEGWIYDEFCEQWKEFDLNKFITHFNTLQVYKLMIEKRCKRIKQIHQMWNISDEKDKNIEIVNQEKLEAIIEIDKLKERETFEKAEITELKNKNQELEEALKNIALRKDQEVKDEISAKNRIQTLALNELAKFAKDCGKLQRMVTKSSPSKKELTEKIKLMEDEKQVLAKKNEEEQKIAKAEYQKVYDESRRLKFQLENSQKNSGKTNHRVRESGRPKYQPQNANGQNLNQVYLIL